MSLSLSHEGEDYVYNDVVNLLSDANTPPKQNEPVQGLQLQPEGHGTIELVSRGVHLGTQKVIYINIFIIFSVNLWHMLPIGHINIAIFIIFIS